MPLKSRGTVDGLYKRGAARSLRAEGLKEVACLVGFVARLFQKFETRRWEHPLCFAGGCALPAQVENISS